MVFNQAKNHHERTQIFFEGESPTLMLNSLKFQKIGNADTLFNFIY